MVDSKPFGTICANITVPGIQANWYTADCIALLHTMKNASLMPNRTLSL